MKYPQKLYIYMVRCGDAFKLGVSALPEQRLQLIRTDNHEPTETIGMYQVDNAYQLEDTFHGVLKDAGLHIGGEWFNYDAEIVDVLIEALEANENDVG